MEFNTQKSRVGSHLLILALVAAGFLPGFNNFFSGDDYDWLFNTVRTVNDPSTFLGEQSNFVRHGESLYFIINYLFAGFSYPVYFLTALAIHLANVLLVSRLLVRAGCSDLPALAGALLWGLNYRHSEAIFRPYGVADPLAMVFCLGALLLYIGRKPWLSALVLLGGLFSKENALVLPALAVLWAVLLEPRAERVRRLVETVPQWLAVGLFLPLMVVLRADQSSYLSIDPAVFSRFWEIVVSMVAVDWFFLRQVVIGSDAPMLPLWLAIVLLVVLAAALWRMPDRYRFSVLWIAVTTAPTVFVPFQMSRYYYAPLVGLSLLVGLLGSDVAGVARRRGFRLAMPAAGVLYGLYLAHAVWGLQLEESDYQFMGHLHRQAALSFRTDIADNLPDSGGPLTLFVRGDTTFWADALQRQCNDRPWYWPTTYKWVYRRPFGVLGLTNTFGFVTSCMDGLREPPLFVAVPETEYERAMADDDFIVVVHENHGNAFRLASEEERRDVAEAASASDLYRYLQPGRIDPTATGGRQLGH